MRIRGFEKLTDIRDFSLVKREGEHSECRFTICATLDDALALTMESGDPVTVSQDDGTTLFYGLIREIAVAQNHYGATVAVVANSASILADEEFKTRFFQRERQTLADILPSLPWKKHQCDLDLGEFGGKNPTGFLLADKSSNAVVQNNETDFAFLRQLVHDAGGRLWIQDTMTGKTGLRVAKSVGDSRLVATDIVNLTKTRTPSGDCLTVKTFRTVSIDTGQKIKIDGVKGATGSYIVMGKRAVKERGILAFIYELAEESDAQMPSRCQTRLFTARITDNNDPEKQGRVQVDFTAEDVEDRDKGSLWIPYRTPYGGAEGQGGIVFLPDKGDRAEVLLTDNHLWVANACRSRQLLSECADPKEKYIGNNQKQRIFWREKSLELYSFKNKIILDEEKIELSIGEGKTRIVLDKDKILLTAPAGACEISANGIKIKTPKNIVAQCGSNLEMQGDGRGSVEMRGNLDLSGAIVNIG